MRKKLQTLLSMEDAALQFRQVAHEFAAREFARMGKVHDWRNVQCSDFEIALGIDKGIANADEPARSGRGAPFKPAMIERDGLLCVKRHPWGRRILAHAAGLTEPHVCPGAKRIYAQMLCEIGDLGRQAGA